MTNSEVAKLLRNVAASYVIKNEAKYRFQIIAYQKAADAIEGSVMQLKDLLKEDKLELIPGVGPAIQAHIKELFKTGKVKRFDWIMEGIPKSMFPLLDVPTFGPKKAYRLVKEFNLRNPKTVIADIKKLAQKNKIAPLEGFGEKSESDLIRAFKEYKLGKGKTKRMALPYAGEIAEKLLEYMKKCKAVEKINFLGSLRRMKDTIGDVDLAVGTQNPKEVIDFFVAYPYKERIIEKGPTSAALLISGGKQVDLLTVSVKSYGALLQHFTGSKNHNIHLRELALKKGMSLSERGIKVIKNRKQTLLTFETEEAFYKALGMSLIVPEMREDTGEIELALQHNLPKIVELKDIKGDLHIHSSYVIEPSHDLGQNTMEEILKYAQELQYEYLGFSEHNPSVSKHSPTQIYSILSKRKEKIEQLKKSNKNIRIINLLETDILANGDLAINNKALETLDATIVSIHSSFGMDKESMTKRILEGLSHPKAKIFAHPTGRLINQRSGYEVDFEKLFEFCKKYNKALEINAWPSRLDLSDNLIRQAVQQKVMMVINTDSHAVWQMDMLKYGVAQARRGWAQKHDILNTLSYNEFMDWLRR